MKITIVFLLLIGTIFQFEQSNADEVSLPKVGTLPSMPSYYDILISGVKYSFSSAYSGIQNGAKSSASYVQGLWSPASPSSTIPTGGIPPVPSLTDAL